MNNSKPSSKVGLIDIELNDITKILFVATLAMSVIMVGLKGMGWGQNFCMICITHNLLFNLKGWDGPWYFYVFRFVLLFSYLIPISLRVNLDMGKIYYSLQIQRDRLVVEIIYNFEQKMNDVYYFKNLTFPIETSLELLHAPQLFQKNWVEFRIY